MCVSLSKWFSPFIFINKDDPYSIWRFIFKNHFYKVKDLSRRLKIERSISVTASCLNCTKSCSYYIYIYSACSLIPNRVRSSRFCTHFPLLHNPSLVRFLLDIHRSEVFYFYFSRIFICFFLGDNILFHPFSNLVDNWISSV